MVTRQEKNQTKRGKKKWLWIPLIVLFVLVIGGCAYAYSIYQNVKSTVDNELHKPVEGIDVGVSKKKVEDKEPINILLLGVDERKNDKGRSDTMIVMTLDPDQNQMQLLSIPRDTRTEIIGKGFEDKINHAYAFGNSEMSVDTVENFLDIDLDYYVRMNMEGLAQLVDAVGGITVNNDQEFSQGGYTFGTGQIQLDGKAALAYSRMRKQDPKGDLGRNQRQRQIIEGIIDKGAGVNIVNQIDDIMSVLGDNMATNMNFEDMRSLAMNYRSARKNISTYQMAGNGTKIDGIYYMIMPEEEIAKAHEMVVGFGE
ncbi:LCP family glycopolymer transferase [Virgibacillus siamensis]|uniref:LCP family glycopolymer transferase n=1 Tax=Virgibacillus siamensis TaxID=480071 RepID=UPI00098726F2|nr:LCP family protein [Virgibacillus siamensis]